jgi:hypothetical protein
MAVMIAWSKKEPYCQTNLNRFWSLTDDEIMEAIFKITIHASGDFTNYELVRYLPAKPEQHYGFRKLSYYWLDCGCDRTLMRIKYADEIAEL